MKSEITADFVLDLLTYNAESGVFMWKRPGKKRVISRPAGNVAANGYRYVRLSGTLFLAHRLAWLYVHGKWPTEQIDHINCQRDDNRICNLRLATQGQNKRNRPAQRNNTSGYKGVSWFKNDDKWRATISVGRRWRTLGYFDSAEAAYVAYCVAAEKLHGEYARVA